MIVASGRLSGVLSCAQPGTLPARLCTHATDSTTYVEIDTSRRLVVSVGGTATTGDAPLWRSGESLGTIDVSVEAGGGSVATRVRVRVGGDVDTVFDPLSMHAVTHGAVSAGSVTLGSGVSSVDSIPSWSTSVLASVEYRTLPVGAFTKASNGYTYANATTNRYVQTSASTMAIVAAANAQRIGSYDGANYGRLHARSWTNVIPHADDFSVNDGTYGWWLEGQTNELGLPGPAGVSNAARFANTGSGFGLNTYVVIPTSGQACTHSIWVQAGVGNGAYSVELEGSPTLSDHGTVGADWTCRSVVGAASSGWIEWNCWYYGITIPAGPYDSRLDYPQIETGAVEHPFAATTCAADDWTIPAASVVDGGKLTLWLRAVPLWSLASGGAHEQTGTSVLFAKGDVSVTLTHSTRTITVTVGGASQTSSAITIASRRTRYDIFVRCGSGAPEIRIRPVGGSSSTILSGGAAQSAIASTGTLSVLTDTGVTGQFDALVEHVRWYTSTAAPSWASDAPSGTTGTAAGELAALEGSATGTVIVTGSGAGSLDALVGSATGLVVVTGSGAGALEALVGSGSGGLSDVTGTGSGALAALDGAGTGSPVVTGSGTGDLGELGASGVGSPVVTGSGTGALSALDSAGSGTVLVTGSGSGSLDPLAAVGSGSPVVTGSAAGALDPLEGAGVGTIVVTGSGDGVLAPLESYSGDPIVSGTGAGDLAPLDGSAVGTVLVTGSAAGVLGELTSVGAGAPVVTGTGAGQLSELTGSATGSPVVTGTGAGSLSALDGTGAGTVGSVVTGTGDGALSALEGACTGTVVVTGSGSGALDPLTSSGVGLVVVTGSGAGVLEALEGSDGASLPTVTGDGAGVIEALVSSAAGSPVVAGTADGALDPLTGSASGTLVVVGAVVGELPELSSLGLGSPVVTGSGAGELAATECASLATVRTIRLSLGLADSVVRRDLGLADPTVRVALDLAPATVRLTLGLA